MCIFTSTGENSKVICFPTVLFIFPCHTFIRNILSLNVTVLYPGWGTGSFVPRPGLQNQVSHRKGPRNVNFKQTSHRTHTQLSGAPSYRMKGGGSRYLIRKVEGLSVRGNGATSRADACRQGKGRGTDK